MNGVFRCEYFAGTRIRTLDLPTQLFLLCSLIFHSGFWSPPDPQEGGPFEVTCTLVGHFAAVANYYNYRCTQPKLPEVGFLI